MRALLFILTSAIVVGIVVFVVINAPVTPQRKPIEVPRVELSQKTQPVLESDPAAERILEFFPDVKTPAQTPAEPAPTAAAETKPEKPKLVSDQEVDINRLMAMIDDWIYINFSQIGTKNKIGQIRRTRENVTFDVKEGETLDNGIVVAQLTSDAATLRLGEATFALRLALEPSFFAEVQQNPRPLTKDEQQKAFDYYSRRFGDKFKQTSALYNPPPGMSMPRPVNPEEYKKGMEDYMNKYGKNFQKEGQQFKVPVAMPKEQMDAYKKYWEQFHPGQPMPNFKDVLESGNQFGPGNRIQDAPAVK